MTRRLPSGAAAQLRTWTEDELAALADETLTNREVSEITGRSIEGVASKRRSIKAGWTPGRSMSWTDDEDDFILRTWHLTAKEVSSQLGRSYHAVTSRRSQLGEREGVTAHAGHKSDPATVGRRRLLAKTCPKCGLLLEASWFHRNYGKWRTYCLRCQPVREKRKRQTKTATDRQKSKALARRLQALSLSTATKSNQPWTESDHKVLCDPDLTVIEKAIRLNRTYYATSQTCTSNRYASKVGRGASVNGVWVIDNPNEVAA